MTLVTGKVREKIRIGIESKVIVHIVGSGSPLENIQFCRIYFVKVMQ